MKNTLRKRTRKAPRRSLQSLPARKSFVPPPRPPGIEDARVQIAAVVAHQLRNRLSGVVFGAEMIMTATGQDPALTRAAARLRRGVDELVVSFNHIVELVRVLSGDAQLRVEQLDIAALVATAVERAKPAFASRELQLAVELPSKPVFIAGDFTSLDLMVANLLTNAAKFTPAGGRVSVRLSAMADELRLSVSDSGIGIATRRLPRLFEAFANRSDSGRSSSGMGAGLMLVRCIAQLHGGAVVARSEGIGRGSEFVVTIPRKKDTHAALRGNHRVLVIHRDARVRGMIAGLVRSWGYAAHEADDAEAGVERAIELRPEVVIVDGGLAEASACAIVPRLRLAPGLAGSRLILVGGPEREAERVRAMGYDHYLPAGFGPESLQALLIEA